ncbi:phosphoserine aminotransferase [Ascodesmis nigricans]|uniref:phosphoserine transaminase n=1 Tax=Ascodesmis nigricans TaxID=341454 RepID=A0A4S2N1A1_9PEZI|nr:phosphoserine aminotransferase [Ascodesmis nigricans]
MPTREEIAYFGAGPASLPTPVIETASAAIVNYQSSGLGILEQSHRSSSSAEIITTATSHLASLINLPSDGSYSIIFMQGGGTGQFAATAYNMLAYKAGLLLKAHNNNISIVKSKLAEMKADYLVTGSWSKKAAAELGSIAGKKFLNVAASSTDFSIPPEDAWKLTEKEKELYAYYCDNETIDGVEFPGFPAALEGRDVVVDMSSNVLSRQFDPTKYAIIFAGAQKNVGPAGVTIVVVRSDVLQNQPDADTLRELGLPVPPIVFHYPTIVKAGSLYNTLPIFDVFICREVMAGLVLKGGLAAQEQVANRKAKLLYDALDAGEGVFEIVPKKGVRSRMNICFRLKGGEDAEKRFLKGAEAKGLTGLKGHRSVGGMRISNYNSIPLEAAEKLAGYINDFVKTEK